MSILIDTSFASAEEASPSPTPQTPVAESFLGPKMERILKTAMKVVSENDGVVKVELPGNHSLANGTQILFFRKKGIRLDMIATGLVKGETPAPGGRAFHLQIELDKDAIIKYPREGDFAAPLADPNAFGAGEKKEQFDFLMPIEPEVSEHHDLPGYFEGALGLFYGNLSSTTSSVVNEAKASSGYRFAPIHFGYFFNFAPIGIEYDRFSGNFPTRTFQGSTVTSSEAVKHWTLNYRFGPFIKKRLELQAQAVLMSREFTTDNPDESLISSQMSGLGLGGRAVYWFRKPNWVRERGESFLSLDQFFVSAHYYPSVSVSDLAISRGNDSPGSFAYDARVGLSIVAYFDFIPFFHRWFAQASAGYMRSSLKFSGTPVQSNQPFPATIPQDSRATESEVDVRFLFGFRIEDPLYLLFSRKKDVP